MLNFNYPRTPTSALIHLRFSNGEVWEVPAQVVADHRDAHFAYRQEDTVGEICKCILAKDILITWVNFMMRWPYLAPHARKIKTPLEPFDYAAELDRAKKEVVGEF